MKNVWRARLCMGAFLAVCLVPSLGMILLPPEEAAANQRLSPVPQWLDANGKLNLSVLDELTEYVSDHLGMRQALITYNAKLNAALFGVSTEEQVVLGKDGWLFYTETMDDYLHTNTMTEGELFAASRSLALLGEYLQGQGIELYVTVAPNKATLYPEYLPAMGTPLEHPTNLEQLSKWLEQEGVTYIDLMTPMSETDDILYYRTDSHWTEIGAGLAHDILIHAMGKTDQLPFYGSNTTQGQGKLGDLYEMLYPVGGTLEEEEVYERPFTFSYVRPIRDVDDHQIETTSSNSGSLLMFRDSFGNSLHTYLADAYGSALFSRAMPYDLSLLQQFQADTVLIEICERNIRWLGEQAPIFPAPQRVLQGTPPQGNAQFTLSVQSEMNWEGMLRIEGVLQGNVDETSPVYVQLDDVLYEACTTGDRTEGIPFVLLVPEEEWKQGVCILYEEGESLYATSTMTETERKNMT